MRSARLPDRPVMKSFDTIVVGAGTAGCVLAARLAQNSTQNVLLLEAGHNSATELNRLKRVGIIPSASDWQLSAATGRDGYRVYLPRAKAVGGCSLVQGGIALRGFPDDYSSWAVAAGNEWGPDSVLPVFKEIENDADFSSEGHGKDGPVHIERARPDELQNLHRAFIAASLERGLSWCADFNQGDGVGVGLIPRALRNGQRETVRECYLALPRRGSLSLLPDTTARRILLEQGQALGVECSEANGTDLKRFYAGAVVLCAGAIGSPDILLRSGVGPPDELDEAGQRVLHAAPAVGRNLRDHPAFWIEFSLEKEEAGGGHWFQVM
ncbi:MAG: GMC family oxidoreductase, partial [Acidobacteria bacterium]|nr:GMC family oxidoreductase [Acidobacteriota bacterium]